jgi:hypothetical protein
MTSLIDFAISERQKQVVQLKGTKSYVQIGKELGITRGQAANAYRTVKKRAERQGWSPDHDMVHPVPESHYLKGTSTLYGEDGSIKAQWVKSNADRDMLVEFSQELAANIAETVTPIKPRKPAKIARDPDRLVVYPLGDAHIGLYCWAADSGGDWDTTVAEEVMTEAFDYVLTNSPNTETALIVNLGDWLHTDTLSNTTRASGHQLDVHTKWSKIVGLSIKLMRKLIDSALLKHEKVHVINEIGNHDEQSAILLQHAINAAYQNEPRVTVDMSPDVFHWFEFGNNLIGVHHGHKCKPEALYRVMCEDQDEAWGRCKHRTWLSGHVHHESVIDKGSQRVEAFRTVAMPDAYAHTNGFRSPRGQQAITYHIQNGECGRSQFLVQVTKK